VAVSAETGLEPHPGCLLGIWDLDRTASHQLEGTGDDGLPACWAQRRLTCKLCPATAGQAAPHAQGYLKMNLT
jgi:hypothetical protein